MINSDMVSEKRSNRSIAESEERYALAFSGSTDGLWDWDLATNRVYFSARWREMLGYGGSEIGESPEHWFSRIHQADRRRVRRLIDNHIKGVSRFLKSEYRILQKNGSYRWVLR
ncbi:MAG: PAS domain-containing protein [Chitinispirillaceae bacterium]|nr:PAS domain-containing protein [Chitinispirillaceae bacterium]